MFEYDSTFHLVEHVPTADKVRRTRSFFYYTSGPRQAEHSRISAPRFKLPKTDLVQVEREPDEAAITALREGVMVQGRRTRPARIRQVSEPEWLWPPEPPVRFRRNVPTAWLRILLREGRNR